MVSNRYKALLLSWQQKPGGIWLDEGSVCKEIKIRSILTLNGSWMPSFLIREGNGSWMPSFLIREGAQAPAVMSNFLVLNVALVVTTVIT